MAFRDMVSLLLTLKDGKRIFTACLLIKSEVLAERGFSILKKEFNCFPYFQVVLMKRDYVPELRMYLQLLPLPKQCG
jgi:hypothetical protein